MIGIEFERPNECNNFLNDLFENINLSNFKINISEDEIYYNNQNICFDKVYVKGKFKSNIYIVFLNLKIYPKNNTDYEIIKNYKDFEKSNCQLMILINDVNFVEIYFKNVNLKNAILNNLEKKGIKFNIKTISSDSRIIMSVL